MSDSTPHRKFAGERVTPAPTPLAKSDVSTSASPLNAEAAGKDLLAFPIPANESQRVTALRALDILDSPPETAYDEIAELAAQICGCPIGYISFVDDDRRWLKARYGLPAEVTNAPRGATVCSTTICGAEMFVVPDMTQDSRFDRIAIVVGEPHCRFYCGVPLITDEGYALGTLCVLDFEPRRLTFEQTEALRRLSRQVLTLLELRRRLIEHNETIAQLELAREEAAAQKARADELLDNLMPRAITEELKKYGKVQPKYIRSATVLLADFQGFTLLSERAEPAALIGLLDEYFSAFDDIVASHGLEKIKTIGDAYMAVGGVPETGLRHPIDACLAALEIQATAARMKSRSDRLRLPSLELRVGAHTGPVISGVVGNRRFTFDIWGDAVNIASFMEAHCLPGRINVSDTVAGHAKALFELEPRGPVEAKHERTHEMFFLNRLKPEFSSDQDGQQPNESFAAEYDRLTGRSPPQLMQDMSSP
ncbi:MAG TPA: adenylate/guanylate cyclase domain-containing protein [Roseiarcus sp.]|nr:adenylate/guanylate cyclase domain-containing protein [Roseiarcus sp.]